MVQPYPPGTIEAFGGGAVPSGWLLCNGATVSRTTYADLFAKIGIAWGVGDGVNTFHLPDLRGRFVRGRDGGAARDPDRSIRTASNSGGATGDAVGSLQAHEIMAHSHTPGTLQADDGGEHTHFFNGYRNVDAGSSVQVQSRFPIAGDPFDIAGLATGTHSDSISGNTDWVGGNETRPLNAYVNFIIKY